MLKHQFKIIIRRLRRQWLFSSIHTIGLTLGFTCCLLIYLFIRYEVSFDRHHTHLDNLYRINTLSREGGDLQYSHNAPYPLSVALRPDFEDWPAIAEIHWQSNQTIKKEDASIVNLENGMYAEPEIFDVFDIQIIQGVGKEVLGEPGYVLLSESTANLLYDNQNIEGKSLHLNDTTQLQIAGIYADFPATTHLPANYIVSYKSLTTDLVGFDISSWGVTISGSVYARLPEGQSPEAYESRLYEFTKKYMHDENSEHPNELVLQPLKQIHFDTNYSSDTNVSSINPASLWVAASIGLLIILMACFNFLNLSLAQNIRKSSEVGIQKVLGADRKQIWINHFGEAFVLTSLAYVLSIVIVNLALPSLNRLLAKELQWQTSTIIELLGFSLLLMVLMSLLAGAYPAWLQARQQIVEILKSSKTVGDRPNNRVRQFTVVAQFIITLAIISSAITVARQLQHIKNKDLGFKQESIALISIPEPGDPAVQQLKAAWQEIPGIESLSLALGAPTSNNNLHTSLFPYGESPQNSTIRVGLKTADSNYDQLYGLKLLAGRFINAKDEEALFNKFPDEGKKYSIVVNEELIKELGYTNAEEALGKRLVLGFNEAVGEIVGITANFHSTSLYDPVEPIFMMPLSLLNYQAGVKIKAGATSETLSQLEESYKRFFPDHLFNQAFLDESIAQQYLAEQRLFKLLQIFGAIAILIACLGLFGLAALAAEHRKKEISLRKVLGASLSSILQLLSKETLILIGIAILVATPLAWWAMSRWLTNFAYRIDVSWWTFAVAGIVLALLAIITISGQTIKAALANPADALRGE
ncbi:MAG: ABC transporter permease [Chitinophagales bacterium]|nr:ABC transporter permease [Chitinophagales bacterium]